MPEVSVVERKTGRIVRICDVPKKDVPLQTIEWEPGPPPRRVRRRSLMVVKGVADARTHYWRDGAFLPRPALTSKDQVKLTLDEIYVIQSVPAGTEVTMISDASSNTAVVNDAKIEILSRQPAEFTLTIRPPFPWQRQELRVTVSAPRSGLRPTALGTPA